MLLTSFPSHFQSELFLTKSILALKPRGRRYTKFKRGQLKECDRQKVGSPDEKKRRKRNKEKKEERKERIIRYDI